MKKKPPLALVADDKIALQPHAAAPLARLDEEVRRLVGEINATRQLFSDTALAVVATAGRDATKPWRLVKDGDGWALVEVKPPEPAAEGKIP